MLTSDNSGNPSGGRSRRNASSRAFNATRHWPLPVAPPKVYGPCPFWLWNAEPTAGEIRRQIAEFHRREVAGFVIRPHKGLPNHLAWRSPDFMNLLRVAIEEAEANGMYVTLSDSGMYHSVPSVPELVREHPVFLRRGLVEVPLPDGREPVLGPGQTLEALVTRANGQRVAVIDRPIDVKFWLKGAEAAEEVARDIDLFNTDAVDCLIGQVYTPFYETFGDDFGWTITGIYSEGPSLEPCPGVIPGTTGIVKLVSALLGYDFTPHLPALWHEDEPDAARHWKNYHKAAGQILDQTYYKRIHDWCREHSVTLLGHPMEPGNQRQERYFHVPGQNISTWKSTMDNNGTLDGVFSTLPKCAGSAMIHHGRSRSGCSLLAETATERPFARLKELANSCLSRGVNYLFPHAFSYAPGGAVHSADIGPNSTVWEGYSAFAEYCRRLCWINTHSIHVCSIAILSVGGDLPWEAAKIFFETQQDFNYLETRELAEMAHVDADGIQLGGMHYRALVLDGFASVPPEILPMLAALVSAGRVICWKKTPVELEGSSIAPVSEKEDLLQKVVPLAPTFLHILPAQPEIRYRHVMKEGLDYRLFFNESGREFEVAIHLPGNAKYVWFRPEDGTTEEAHLSRRVAFAPYEMKILVSQGPHSVVPYFP